ncbi:hypothetical protein DRJ54_07175 [Candidatus Acetothermia bacterium]|nr:MAG: hypothetical protein DRJ54_07175 [Candidatus Acetothermia bacterium]
MILTEAVSYEELVSRLSRDDRIALVACNMCVRINDTYNEEKMRELAERLRSDGFSVVEGFLVTMACFELYLPALRFSREVDTVVVLSCGAGAANISRNLRGMKVIRAAYGTGLEAGKEMLKVREVEE